METAQKAFDKFSSLRLELEASDDRPQEFLGTIKL